MKLYYRYSPSVACRVIVKEHLDGLGASYELGDLNEIELHTPLSLTDQKVLHESLTKYGIELLSDQQNATIDKIKESIRELVYSDENLENINLSDFLMKRLPYSYGHLSSLFSEATFMSIAHYTMMQKIERIKELLLEGDKTLTEISYRLNYSSVAHLSHQFKKITGLTPTRFKDLMLKKRAGVV